MCGEGLTAAQWIFTISYFSALGTTEKITKGQKKSIVKNEDSKHGKHFPPN